MSSDLRITFVLTNQGIEWQRPPGLTEDEWIRYGGLVLDLLDHHMRLIEREVEIEGRRRRAND